MTSPVHRDLRIRGSLTKTLVAIPRSGSVSKHLLWHSDVRHEVFRASRGVLSSTVWAIAGRSRTRDIVCLGGWR